jgi:hypothetical protein
MNYETRYQKMLDKVRANLIHDVDFLCLIHTPLGTIEVGKIWHRFEGFVAIEGEDENHKYRFLVFSEESICSFPLEMKPKNDSQKPLGFRSMLLPASEDIS